MRMFHIKLASIDGYDWARGNEQYAEQYKEQIEEADRKLAERTALLERIGATPDPRLPLVVTGSQMIELSVGKVAYEVIRELRPGIHDPFDPTDFLREFQVVANKLLNAPALNDLTHHSAYNARCEVHMPGQALSTYNELMLKEGPCTDELQDTIDQGWRIIAACPQPDQRRPDYILGRFNPDRDTNTGARR